MNTEHAMSLLGRLEGDAQVQEVLGPVLGHPDPINDPCIDYVIAANAYLRITRGSFLMVMETYPLPGRPYEEDAGYVDSLWITRDNIQSDGSRLELPADLRWDLGTEEFSQIASTAMRSSTPAIRPCWLAFGYRGLELVIDYTIVDEVVRIEEVAIGLQRDWKKFQATFTPR